MISLKKIQKALQSAEKNLTSFAVIIGEDELSNKCAQVKAMQSRETKEIPLDSLVEHFKKEFSHGS